MLNLARSEIYKLKKSLSLKICFLLSCISAAALAYISHGIAVGSISADISGSASGLTEIVIVSLLGSLMVGVLVCSDFENKTIHDSIVCGSGRMAIVLSKSLIYIFVIFLLLLPYMVTTLVALCSGAEFTSQFVFSVFMQFLSDESGQNITPGMLGKTGIIFLVTVLVDAARLSICIPLALKIRKPVAILVIGFVFSAVIDLIVGLLGKVSFLEDMISFTPFSRDFLLLTLDTPSGTLVKAAICAVVFFGMMVAVTYAAFRKADIK